MDKHLIILFLLVAILPSLSHGACVGGAGNCITCDTGDTYCIDCEGTHPYLDPLSPSTCIACISPNLKYHDSDYPIPMCSSTCPGTNTEIVADNIPSGWCSITNCGSDPSDPANYLDGSYLCKAQSCVAVLKSPNLHPNMLETMMNANSLLGAQSCQMNTLSLMYKNMVYKLTNDCPTGYTKLDSQRCCADHCTACAIDGECTTCETLYQKSLWYVSTKAEYCTLCDQPGEDVIGRIGIDCVRSPICLEVMVNQSFCIEACPSGQYDSGAGCASCEDKYCSVCAGAGTYMCTTCNNGFSKSEGTCSCDNGLTVTDTGTCLAGSSTCPVGYYLDGVLCIPCEDNLCDVCSGPGIQQCEVCTIGLRLASTAELFVISGNYQCVADCTGGAYLIHPESLNDICIIDGIDNPPSGYFLDGTQGKYKKCEDNCEICSEEGTSKCSKCSSGYYLKVETGAEFSESGTYPCIGREGKTLLNANGHNVVILGNSCPDGYYEATGSSTDCIIIPAGMDPSVMSAFSQLIPCVDQNDFTIPMNKNIEITIKCFTDYVEDLYQSKIAELTKTITCSRNPDTQENCLSSNAMNFEPLTGKLSISLPAGAFSVGVYYFTFKLSYMNESKSATTRMTIISKGPYLSIGCRDLERGKGGVFARNKQYKFIGESDANINTLEWKITPPVPSLISRGGLAVTPSNSLEAGGIYTLSVTAQAEGVSVTEWLLVNISQSVQIGEIKVSPTTGTGIIEDFRIQALGWADIDTQEALTYRFSFQSFEGPEFFFSGWGCSPQISLKLPVGSALNQHRVYVRVYARNSIGAVASNQAVVVSTPIASGGDKTDLDIVKEFLLDSNEKTTTQRLQSLILIQSLVQQETDWKNYSQGICPDCGEHGICNVTSQRCVCEENWKLSPKCDISKEDMQKTRSKLNIILNEMEILEESDSNLFSNIENIQGFITNMKSVSYNAPLLELKTSQRLLDLNSKAIEGLSVAYENEKDIDTNTKKNILGVLSDLLEGFSYKDTELNIGEKAGSVQEQLTSLTKALLPFKEPVSLRESHCTPSFCWSSAKSNTWDLGHSALSTSAQEVVLPDGVLQENVEMSYMQTQWKVSPYIGSSDQLFEVGDVMEFALFGEGGKTLRVNGTIPILIKFTVKNPPDVVNCTYFDELLGEYSVSGMELKSTTLNAETGDMIVECLSTHLTSFVILGKELAGALISANYELFSDTSALEDYDPWNSLPFILCLSFGASFVVACTIMFIYLNFCKKKESGRRIYDLPPSPQSSKMGAEDAFFVRPVIENKIAPRVPFSHRGPGPSRFKCMEQGELPGAIPSKFSVTIDTKRAQGSSILEAKRSPGRSPDSVNNSTFLDRTDTPDTSRTIISANDNTIAMESSSIIEEIPEKRKAKCCAKLCSIFMAFHSLLNPFVDDGQKRISRISKLCLLYAEILLLFIISGLFFNLNEDGEEISTVASALLGMLIGLLTLPILILPGILLRRQKLEKYDNMAITEARMKYHLRKQCFRLILGYIVIFGLIGVTNFYINVFAANFGRKLNNVWVMTFVFALTQDFLLLQTIKCIILFFCLSEDALAIALDMCIGNAI